MKIIIYIIILTLFLTSCVTDNDKSITDNDKSITDNGKSIIDDEKSIIDDEKSIIDDEKVFWNWFTLNSDIIFHFEDDQENIFDEIIFELHKIDENLTFEIGPVVDGKREFIISADGIYSSFPSVENLYEERLDYDTWIILKYRQRKNPLFNLDYENILLEPDDVKFAFFDDENPDKTGVILFIDGANDLEISIYNYLGLLFLDQVIGEFDVETYVGTIIVENFESEYFLYALPITMMAEELDKWILYK